MDWQGLPIQELLNELPKGLAVAISLLLIFLGYKKGSGHTTKDVEIAGAIVDNTAIFKLASSIDRHNVLMEQNHDQIRRMVEAFNRHADEIHELTREVRESVTAILRHRR